MSNRTWHLYAIEKPESDGVYDVRLTKKHDSLSAPIETLMEYKDGEWIFTVPMFINEYVVNAWRCR